MARAPLRIVSVCRSLPTPDNSSEGIFVANRLAALARLADLHVIQPVPYLPLVRPLPAWAGKPRQLNGLSITHAPMRYVPGVLKSWDARWLALAIRPVLERLHREKRIDLIDAHFGYPDGAGCVSIGARLQVPVFITLRGFETEFILRPRVGPQLIDAMRGATGCVAVSHSLKALAVQRGVPEERVRVVQNAIDSSVFHLDDPARARRTLGIEPDIPLIVSVGHLVTRKRHHVLIDAFARVARELTNARLVIIGANSFEPDYPRQLRERIAAAGMQERISLLGNQPATTVATWLQAADVFALATAREGCCNAVLEALATGLPVVTTPAGDNAWFVDGKTNGAIVPVDDAQALSAGLSASLSRRDWDRAQISRRLVEQVGSWATVATAALRFMEERLGDGARA